MVMNSAQSISVREGDVTGIPLSVVTSSGWNGRPPVDHHAGDRCGGAGVVCAPGHGHVHRLLVPAEDPSPLPVVGRIDLSAREVEVDREPVVPDELKLVGRRVEEGGSEARQAVPREQLGETPLGLVRIDRTSWISHASRRSGGSKLAPPRSEITMDYRSIAITQWLFDAPVNGLPPGRGNSSGAPRTTYHGTAHGLLRASWP
jgi:hypothetical protein